MSESKDIIPGMYLKTVTGVKLRISESNLNAFGYC